MYKNLTQKRLLEGMRIAKEYGYWSKEVREYGEKFEPYGAREKLLYSLDSLYNSSQRYASGIYGLAKENGLLQE